MRDYLNEQITDAYAIAVSKGWHDGEDYPMRDRAVVASKLALIHSELTEAFYDWAKGKAVTDDVMLELADVAIRSFDLLGSMAVQFKDEYPSGVGMISAQGDEFAVHLLDLHSCVSEALEDMRRKDSPFPDCFSDKMLYLLCLLYGTARSHGGDLKAFVSRKMEYNRLRTHRHGGKLL
jgi:hypothetical protein